MKKLLVAILFLSLVMQYTPMKEMGKLPLLFHHFAKHKSENNKITFLGFLKLHYCNGNPIDDDYEEDMKLPFKVINFDQTTVCNSTHPLESFTIQKTQFFIQEKEFNNYYSILISSSHLPNIWQPPKSC